MWLSQNLNKLLHVVDSVQSSTIIVCYVDCAVLVLILTSVNSGLVGVDVLKLGFCFEEKHVLRRIPYDVGTTLNQH